MSSHLALVADNSRPRPPRPGYRQSLAAGECQHCHRTGCGVRTAGVRRQGELDWTRLALCPECAAAAREQGYTVLS